MSLEAKAHRLLVEGRVTVLEVGCGRPGRARVRGDSGTHDVEFVAGRIACPCGSFKQRCSHALAVGLVVEEMRVRR